MLARGILQVNFVPFDIAIKRFFDDFVPFAQKMPFIEFQECRVSLTRMVERERFDGRILVNSDLLQHVHQGVDRHFIF